MRVLYNFIFIIFGMFYLPYLLLTKRYRYGMREKMGILPEGVKKLCLTSRIIWVHAVSLGEMKAVGALAPFLRKAFPGHKLVFSSVTNTGNQAAKAIAMAGEAVFYLPFDISFLTDRAVAAVKPELFISLEAELWPNLIGSLSRSKTKIALVNGRVSDRSYGKYRMIRPLARSIFSKISLFLMQSETDASRIKGLGVPADKVFTPGNLKFDIRLSGDPDQRENIRKRLGLKSDDILLAAGSTSKGEEEQIIDCYSRLKKDHPGLRLLIAPRHIERTKEIEMLLMKNSFKPVRYSYMNANHEPRTTNNELNVFLLDIIGALVSIYSAADIVFVGGSLVKKRGGQNPIEPAVLSKPIIFGKFMSNYKDIARSFVSLGAAIQVDDAKGLFNAIRLLLENPAEREGMGGRAKAIVEKNSGSASRAIDIILSRYHT